MSRHSRRARQEGSGLAMANLGSSKLQVLVQSP